MQSDIRLTTATLTAVSGLLRTLEPGLTPAERNRVLGRLRGESRTEENKGPATNRSPIHAQKVLRRAQVASLFGVSARTVDSWSRAGILPKVRLPKHRRACGFRASDVDALLGERKAG